MAEVKLLSNTESSFSVIKNNFNLSDDSDEVLRRISKGSTAEDARRAAELLREANISHSVMFLLGLGGEECSKEHAEASGRLLSKMNPAYASALTLTLVPGTPLFEEAQQGRFVLPSSFALLKELKLLLENTHVNRCQFAANHASNYLPIKGRLPDERLALLTMLGRVLESQIESVLVPEWMRGL